jgi:hypothetical protein
MHQKTFYFGVLVRKTLGSTLRDKAMLLPCDLSDFSGNSRRLRTTRQTTLSTISSIASEETQLVTILGTTKCRCLHMCLLWTCMDVILFMDVMLHMGVMNIVMFEWMCWILWYLNECVGYYDVWMDVLYNIICRFCNSSCADYPIFCNFFNLD